MNISVYRIYTSDNTIIDINQSEININFETSVHLRDSLNVTKDLSSNNFGRSETQILLPFNTQLCFKYLMFKCGFKVRLKRTNILKYCNFKQYPVFKLVVIRTSDETLVKYGDSEMQMAGYLQDMSYMVYVVNNFSILGITKHHTKILDLITHYHLIPELYPSLPGLVLAHYSEYLTTSGSNMLYWITMGYYGCQPLKQRTLHDVCATMYDGEIADFVQIIDLSKYCVIFGVVANEVLTRTDQGKLNKFVHREVVRLIVLWRRKLMNTSLNNCDRVKNIMSIADRLQIMQSNLKKIGVDQSEWDIVKYAKDMLSQGKIMEAKLLITRLNTIIQRYTQPHQRVRGHIVHRNGWPTGATGPTGDTGPRGPRGPRGY